MRTITSRQNPLIAKFRAATRTRQSTRQHILLDGRRLIDDALRAGAPIEVALFSPSALLDSETSLTPLARALAASGTEILEVSESVIRAASPVRTPSGVVALARHQPHPLERIITKVAEGLVVVAVGVQDPGNIGAIVRAADAGGARAVVVTSGSADPFGWRALRGAMGSSFRLPVATVDDLSSLVQAAREEGAQVVATIPRGGTEIHKANLAGPRLILIGHEGEGLASALDVDADLRVSVPMRRRVDSLNVAVAAALIIYEARHQNSGRHRSSARAGRIRKRGIQRKTS